MAVFGRNYSQLGNELEDMVENMDVQGIGGYVVTGGLGGILGNEVAQFVTNQIGMAGGSAMDKFASALAKAVFGALLIAAGRRMGDQFGSILTVAGGGSWFVAAPDLFDAFEQFTGFQILGSPRQATPQFEVSHTPSQSDPQSQSQQSRQMTQSHQPVEETRTAASAGY